MMTAYLGLILVSGAFLALGVGASSLFQQSNRGILYYARCVHLFVVADWYSRTISLVQVAIFSVTLI